jgi:hypothetical protein
MRSDGCPGGGGTKYRLEASMSIETIVIVVVIILIVLAVLGFFGRGRMGG